MTKGDPPIQSHQAHIIKQFYRGVQKVRKPKATLVEQVSFKSKQQNQLNIEFFKIMKILSFMYSQQFQCTYIFISKIVN